MVYEGPSNWTILKHPNYLFFPEFREIFLWNKPAKTTLYLPQGWRQPVLISAFCLSASCFNVWWSFQLSAVVGSLHKRAIAEAIPTTRRQMNAELFNHHPHVLQSVQRQDKSFHRWLLDDFCSCWMTLQDWYLLLSPTHTVCWWQAGSRGNADRLALWRQLEEFGITLTSRLLPGLLQLKGSSWYSCKAGKLSKKERANNRWEKISTSIHYCHTPAAIGPVISSALPQHLPAPQHIKVQARYLCTPLYRTEKTSDNFRTLEYQFQMCFLWLPPLCFI